MDPQTQALLQGFWGWAGGIVALVVLGGLLPFALGALLGMLPLARSRADYRPVRAMLAVVMAFLAVGLVVLLLAPSAGPTRQFWIVLSVQIGLMVLLNAAFWLARLARRRVREEAALVNGVSAPVELDASPSNAALEPGPRARLNAIDAEYYVRDWLLFLGAHDAVVTRARRDGGVDVRSASFVVQVKHRPADIVSVDVVRALAGVAQLEGRAGLVFTSGRFSRDALDFATRSRIGLFIFRPGEGRLVAANAQARSYWANGLHARPTHLVEQAVASEAQRAALG